MTARPVLIGLLDSGLPAAPAGPVAAARAFTGVPLAPDPGGHGSRLAAIIWRHAPDAALLNAQVFGGGGRGAPAQVAEGLDWLRDEGAGLITMSFGLTTDRPVLAAAVERAQAAGMLLLAAAPARGRRVWPAGYPGVIAVTGDARCGFGDISDLGGRPANLGASPCDAAGRPGGASLAVAHVAGLLAARLAQAADPAAALAELRRAARYRGPERRSP